MTVDLELQSAVRISRRFHRSVNVELDFDRADALHGYCVSSRAQEVILRIVEALADPDAGRCWTLIGPYGTGKSSLVAFLTSVLCVGAAPRNAGEIFRQSWPATAERFEASLARAGQLAPVLITGERQPIAEAVLNGLRKAADRFFSGRGVKPAVVSELSAYCARGAGDPPVTNDEILKAMTDLAEAVDRSSRPGRGLFIVIDEMGKLLEWAALHPERSDIYLLQRLAEPAGRSSSPIALLTVQHQGVRAYARRLTKSATEEWIKVAGRFEAIPLLEPANQIVRLLDKAIDAAPSVSTTAAAKECTTVAAGLADRDPRLRALPLATTCPLHPLTALCIGPLFRTSLGQNERSVFAFLSSTEPLSFRDWLNGADGSRPYRLADLFDYVALNTRASVDGPRTWTSADYALSRLRGDAPPLDAELIKVIGMLAMLRTGTGINADEQVLAWATGRTIGETREALERLAARAVILYRHHLSAWTLWDGSDVDIEAAVAAQREQLLARGGLAEQIESVVEPTPITASRHYIQWGTFRVLRVRYASSLESARRASVQRGDGVLIVLVPDRLDDVADLRGALENEPSGPETEAPRALTVPVNVDAFYDLGLDYLAVCRALEKTPQLENDPIARRALQERQLQGRDALLAAHQIACGGTAGLPTRWRWRGAWISVDHRVSRTASRLFDQAFCRAPQIHNELINRAHISSAAAAARRELMQRMLLRSAEERLGIEGHPPELSLYRSILERGGLHRKTDTGWSFRSPDDDAPLASAWSQIELLVREADHRPAGRVSFDYLARALARPPYGVRAGVAPILIWAWYLVHKDDVFLYEENTFAPRPDEPLVERLLRRPADIDLQSAEMSGDLARVASAIQRQVFPDVPTDKGQVPLRILARLVRFFRDLSPYATRTREVSQLARAVRTTVNSAKDNVRLLMDDLPRALEIDTGAPEQAGVYAELLDKALRELSQVDDRLLDRIERTLCRLFRVEAPSAEFRRSLANRASKLDSRDDLEFSLRRFVAQTADLNPDQDDSRALWLRGIAAAIEGRPPHLWSDSDYAGFGTAAAQVVRKFQAAELFVAQLGEGNLSPGQHYLMIDYLDTDGSIRGQQGFIDIDQKKPEIDKLIDQALEQFAALAASAQDLKLSGPERTYAILRAMSVQLADTSFKENR